MEIQLDRQSPAYFLHHLTKHKRLYNLGENTIVVLGRRGPTGKSWITQRLTEQGYKAIEISESVSAHVEYQDNLNHLIVNPYSGIVTLILNRLLKDPEKQEEAIGV